MNVLKYIWEQWAQILILTMSAITNSVMEEEQVLLNKTKMNFNLDFKMTDYKNDLEKDEILYIKMEIADI